MNTLNLSIVKNKNHIIVLDESLNVIYRTHNPLETEIEIMDKLSLDTNSPY